MIARRYQLRLHPSENAARSARSLRCASALLLSLSIGLAGCHHKPTRSPLPVGILAPVALEAPSPDVNPPEIATVPPPEYEQLPDTSLPTQRRRPATVREQPIPAPPPGNDTPLLALGALSIGGDNSSHTPQQVQDLIASVLKRISGFPTQIAAAQKREIRQARNFLDQAQKALKSGDSEGANTLAVKANLLLDDVEKK